MKIRLLLASLLLSGISLAAPEKLFDGKTLTGWKLKGSDYWTAADGILKGESDDKKQSSILWTEKSYKDFTMEFEFRFSGDIDSGVFLRNENEQIQIGTSRSLKRDMTGSPYIGNKGKYPQEAEGVKDLLKTGEWNKMKIVAKGNTYTVTLNGKQVIEYVSDTAKSEPGPLGLQIHPGVKMKIEFKDLAVEEA
ncbi:3-keto-disaccharide hydrolase [Luteolibacter luteus]|uniref:DUF1080 domain-containing protein n=1 Tax=Luteolibacter luteus TaxID=2728835 RepID=A0A858RLA6_9BACT|nr:DUF1080 domain-containing protein [Luteolibacter luteus]QJE97622.1 DUF1080 domain-containing protein [Luteolibacter luteus]